MHRMKLAGRFLRERGAGYVLKKGFQEAFTKPARRRRVFRELKDRYPNPLIFIAGKAKGGSTWFGNMLTSIEGYELRWPMRWLTAEALKWDDFEATNLYPEIVREFRNQFSVIKGHTWGFKCNVDVLRQWGVPYMITLRDPRDALISHYFYSRNRPANWDHATAMKYDRHDYITHKLESGELNRASLDWYREWLKNRDESMSILVRYEDALKDPAAVLTRMLQFFKIPADAETVARITAANSFKSMSGGRSRGKEDESSFFRKGVSGEWRATLTDSQKKLFAEIGEDVIRACEYPATLS